MKKIIIFFIVIFFMIQDCFINYALVNKSIEEDSKFYVIYTIEIYEILTETQKAQIKINVLLNHFNINAEEVVITIVGGGQQEIICKKIGLNKFQGVEANKTIWIFDGFGETYPFDSYSLSFELYNILVINGANYELNSFQYKVNDELSKGVMKGSKQRILSDTWFNDGGIIPNKMSEQRFTLFLKRKWQTPFLQIVLPIIACYYLLASSLLLNPIEKVEIRLRIYLSLFIFSPTFFLAIQSFLPYRSKMSIPEFLLTNLLLSNTVFGVATIITNWWTPRIKDIKFKDFIRRFLDIVASLLCSQILFIILISTLIRRINIYYILVLLIFTLPSHIAYYSLLPGYLKSRSTLRNKDIT